MIEVDRAEKTKISSIKFIGNKKISSRKLRDIITSEETNFEILNSKYKLSNNLLDLDTRLITNYYRSSGFYDAKATKVGKNNDQGKVELIYSIDEGNRYSVKKFLLKLTKYLTKIYFFP